MRFTARLAATDFNPAALGDYPAGSLTGWLVAQGEPRELDLQWRFEKSTLYEHGFESEGSARVAGRRVTQADAELRQGENRLSAKGAFGRPGDELAVTLDAPRLEQFAPVSGRLLAKGTVSGSLENPRARISAAAEQLAFGAVELATVNATLDGTLGAHDVELRVEAPQYALQLEGRLLGGWSRARGWNGDIRWLRNAGEYPVELATPAPLRVAPGRVELGRFEARLQQGRVLVREAMWTPARLASSGEFTGLPAQWLIVAAGLGGRLDATLLLEGEWQLAKSEDLEGFLRVRRAGGDIALRADEPIELDLERLVLEARFAQGTARAEVEAVSRIARLSARGQVLPRLAVEGKVDFAELRALVKPFDANFHLDGRLAAELRLTGTLAKPEFHGTLLGDAIALDYPPYGVALKDGHFRAILQGDSLELETFEIRGGDGRFLAQGTLPLAPGAKARLSWRAQELAALQRPDMRLVVTGSGEATYDGSKATLTGDLRADRGHFEFARERLPRLSEDVVIVGDTKIVRAEPKGRIKLPVVLDIRIDLGEHLVVQGYGYDGKVTGLIDIATTKDGELRAFGRLTAVNATFLAYGQQLQVDPGVLIFDGPIDNPSLQITAWRRNQAVEAGVQITGTARAPSVNLVSQPPVPEGERLSWLVLGRPPSGATQADIGLLQAAAGALLAGGDSVPLDRRIARRFGFDELTLRGSGELTGQVLAVGKRLSDRLYISYEQGIGAVAQNLIKLDYALGRRWTLRAETGSSSGGGLFYRYSWD
jgi:translocation and assembly module TamB